MPRAGEREGTWSGVLQRSRSSNLDARSLRVVASVLLQHDRRASCASRQPQQEKNDFRANKKCAVHPIPSPRCYRLHMSAIRLTHAFVATLKRYMNRKAPETACRTPSDTRCPNTRHEQISFCSTFNFSCCGSNEHKHRLFRGGASPSRTVLAR